MQNEAFAGSKNSACQIKAVGEGAKAKRLDRLDHFAGEGAAASQVGYDLLAIMMSDAPPQVCGKCDSVNCESVEWGTPDHCSRAGGWKLRSCTPRKPRELPASEGAVRDGKGLDWRGANVAALIWQRA